MHSSSTAAATLTALRMGRTNSFKCRTLTSPAWLPTQVPLLSLAPQPQSYLLYPQVLFIIILFSLQIAPGPSLTCSHVLSLHVKCLFSHHNLQKSHPSVRLPAPPTLGPALALSSISLVLCLTFLWLEPNLTLYYLSRSFFWKQAIYSANTIRNSFKLKHQIYCIILNYMHTHRK